MRRLRDLSEHGIVRMCLHRLVLRETATRRAQEYKEGIKKVVQTSRAVAWMNDHLRSTLQDAVDVLQEDEHSTEFYIANGLQEWVGNSKATVVEIDPADTTQAWDAYFSGGPPFDQPKNRDHIPDSFILAALARLMAAEKGKWHAVCGDKLLRTASEKLGAVAHESIGDFVVHDEVKSAVRAHAKTLTSEQQVANWTTEVKALLADSQKVIQKAIQDALLRDLIGKDVHDSRFPSDDCTASVSGIGTVSVELDVDSLEDLGQDAAMMPASIHVDPLNADVFIDKHEYYGASAEEQADYPVWDGNWNDWVVAAEVSRPAIVQGTVRIEFKPDKYAALGISAVELDDIHDVSYEWPEK